MTYLDNYAPYGLYQRIPTHGGRDFEYFTYKGHHYLVACNEYTRKVIYTAFYQSEYETDYVIDSVIYWWTGKDYTLIFKSFGILACLFTFILNCCKTRNYFCPAVLGELHKPNWIFRVRTNEC